MKHGTGIEWTHIPGYKGETWNPVTGCTKVSDGCKFCYAEREWIRWKANPKSVQYGREFTDVATHEKRLGQPRQWDKPRAIFVNSMSDLFHDDVPFQFLFSVFETMAQCPHHIFMVLTKRPERMLEFERWIKSQATFPAIFPDPLGDPDRSTFMGQPWPLPNVWLGVSIENQETADDRIPTLLRCAAAIRFISYEPALGPVDLDIVPWPSGWDRGVDDVSDGIDPLRYKGKRGEGIDWVIVGGESGPGARPSHPNWFNNVRYQCAAANVPFFFKQWGEWAVTYDRDIEDPDWRKCPTPQNHKERYLNFEGGHGFHGERVVFVKRVGRKEAGNTLSKRLWHQFPDPLGDSE